MKQSDAPNRRKEGNYNEQLARDFLVKKGYAIVHEQWKFGKVGEIDLICKDGETLVFVEVKARANYDFGKPEDAVTPGKRMQIRRVARGYLYVNKVKFAECRFDVVAVDYVSGKPEIRHWVHAFD